ncbi:MAG: alanine racemase [Candidatus Harrisonbacteria bacterium]|nr:alanine racemase [Candidatus Harrisonbacteria bacterium]
MQTYAKDVRTWIEIEQSAVFHNVAAMRKFLSPKTQFFAVVKSNAYGHGIFAMPPVLLEAKVDGFCVDSIIEAVAMRERGLTAPILVLGVTLPPLYPLAEKHGITLTMSSRAPLAALAKLKNPPQFHLKIDTGMHRQGFYLDEFPGVIKMLKKSAAGKTLTGAYTHFASAKDINYPTYTDMQVAAFDQALAMLHDAGWKKLTRHAAATAGALVSKKYHYDLVRVGIGIYGLYPSKELRMQIPEADFRPILSWHTIVGEVKTAKKGDYVGYDLVERLRRDSTIAVLPVGYWHGFPRALSGVGEVLVNGKRAKVLGRVSMDMIAVDVTGISCHFGDKATLIGRQGKEEITAEECAAAAGGASYYEYLTRLNPLIERVVV